MYPAQTTSKAALAGATNSNELIDASQSILGWWLDKKVQSINGLSCSPMLIPLILLQDGHSVTEPSIFRKLTSYWEKSFFDDMARLHVLPPDTVTRVSEYVPEIVSFVERIMNNGFAYMTGKGDVWFDVAAFEGAKRKGKGKEREVDGEEHWEHVYAKLAPWSKGNRELLEEGEGQCGGGQFPEKDTLLNLARQAPLPPLRASAPLPTLHSGNRRSQESPPGLHLGEPAVRAGTSSARSWPARSWARTWTFTREASTSCSRITTMRLRSPRWAKTALREDVGLTSAAAGFP